ncbi:hypothetical protein [Kordia jejudonensis]|uniref:hypothetical protein n=1 Tax=Kordia jejudonensis TaxID=1348245 RepID=UPI0006298EB9|nr:hypothetical protein [Kordia jejudonensis]
MPQKRNIKGLLDSLVDKDGLKTEVTINITNRTLTRLSLTLLGTGVAIIIIARLANNLKIKPSVKAAT